MNILSAKNVFSDIFDWFANLSSKLPAIDYKTYFIVVVALILGIGLIVALTYFGSYRFKLLIACKKIIAYLAEVDAVDNDNFGDFTSQCFSEKVPSTLRDCWVQYLGVRFGYPSDIVSEQNVYDKEVKRVREIRANVFIAVALILIAIFSFWGYGRLDGKDMGVIFLASLLLSGVIYLVLVIINKILSNTCLDAFSNMQEDLDAKVVFQVEKTFATDASPLGDLAAIIDEIIARNTAKEIGFEFGDEQTPIEELIAKADEKRQDKAAADGKESEPIESIDLEETEEDSLTIDDILFEEIEPTVFEEIEPTVEGEPAIEEEKAAESEPVKEEPAVDEPISENEPIADEKTVNAEEPTADEPVAESELEAESAIEDESEIEVEREIITEEEPLVVNGAIDGIVEDINVESETEQQQGRRRSDIIGEPVEIIVDNKSGQKEQESDTQKKTVNDGNEQPNEEPAVEEKTEDQTPVENEPIFDEQPLTDEPKAEEVQESEAAPEVEESSVETVNGAEETQIAEENQPEEPEVLKEEAAAEKESVTEEPAAEEQTVEEEPVIEESVIEEAVSETEPTVEEAVDAAPVGEEPAAEPVKDEEPVVKAEKEEKKKPQQKKAKADKKVDGENSGNADYDEPIIQYVMDGPMDDDDEIVKPAQLVKMPNLVDYMITNNVSPKVKMNIVNKLMASYKKFENSEEDKQIITDCIKKLMADLQGKK